MEKIFISGPISYNVKDAKRKFEYAEKRLKETYPNAEIINPLKLHTDYSKPWAYYMRIGIKALMDCTDIYMLKSWRESKGACIEFELASDINISITFE